MFYVCVCVYYYILHIHTNTYNISCDMSYVHMYIHLYIFQPQSFKSFESSPRRVAVFFRFSCLLVCTMLQKFYKQMSLKSKKYPFSITC